MGNWKVGSDYDAADWLGGYTEEGVSKPELDAHQKHLDLQQLVDLGEEQSAADFAVGWLAAEPSDH